MKIKLLKLVIATGIITGALTGCGLADKLFTAQTTVTPGAIIGTNIVTVSASTNAAGVVTPPQVIATPVYGPAVTNVTYVTSASTQSALNTGNVVAGVLPQPYGGLATLALGGLSALLGIWGTVKSKQLVQSQQVAALVNPIIAGVELGNDPATKAAIQSHAAAAGVQPALDAKVQAVSVQMPDATIAVPVASTVTPAKV